MGGGHRDCGAPRVGDCNGCLLLVQCHSPRGHPVLAGIGHSPRVVGVGMGPTLVLVCAGFPSRPCHRVYRWSHNTPLLFTRYTCIYRFPTMLSVPYLHVCHTAVPAGICVFPSVCRVLGFVPSPQCQDLHVPLCGVCWDSHNSLCGEPAGICTFPSMSSLLGFACFPQYRACWDLHISHRVEPAETCTFSSVVRTGICTFPSTLGML